MYDGLLQDQDCWQNQWRVNEEKSNLVETPVLEQKKKYERTNDNRALTM